LKHRAVTKAITSVEEFERGLEAKKSSSKHFVIGNSNRQMLIEFAALSQFLSE
jgi:hypothetical protein